MHSVREHCRCWGKGGSASSPQIHPLSQHFLLWGSGYMEGKGSTWCHLPAQLLGRGAPMHRGWPEFSRLESNTPGLGPQAGGQVYISPDKFCEAKDKGAGGGGGRRRQQHLPLIWKLERKWRTGVSPRCRHAQGSGPDIGQGTRTSGEAVPCSLSQEASWGSHNLQLSRGNCANTSSQNEAAFVLGKPLAPTSYPLLCGKRRQ